HLRMTEQQIEPRVSPADVTRLRAFIRGAVHVDDKIMQYIVRLGRATRAPDEVGRADLRELLTLGVSPRSYQHVLALTRVTAFLHGRTYALPQDVKAIYCDASRSMELGAAHRSKKELMTFITGSLLFSAVSDQINIGFLAFSDRVLEYSPPRRTRAAAWSVLERCWSLSPRPGRTAIAPAIRYLLTTLKRMSVVFIVSDFISDEDLF